MSFFYRAKKMALVSFIAISSFFNLSKVESVDCFDCCDFSFCNWDFTIGADYLYWKPCTSNLDYAVVLDRDPFQGGLDSAVHYDIKNVCPDYESGYRVYVNGSSSCGSSIGFAASYTQIKANQSDTVIANARTVLPTALHPYQENLLVNSSEGNFSYPSASADWNSNYREWSFGGTYHSGWNYCNRIGYFLGVTGMNFDEYFDTKFFVAEDSALNGVVAFSKTELNYCGWGVKFGSQYEYLICRGLNFFTHLNGSVLVGDGKNKTTYGFYSGNEETHIIAPDYVFDKEDCCRVVPGYHLDLGINYDACICNFNFNFRIGYEFVGWYNIPYYRTFVEGIENVDETNKRILNLAISSSADVQDLSYHGMFVGLAFQF